MKNYFNKNSFSLRSVLWILGSLVIIGCASTEDVGRMQWDLNELRSEVRELKKGAKTSGGISSDAEKKLAAIQETQKSTAGTVSDLLIKVQDLTTEFQVLTGRFEETRYFAEKSSTELTAEKDMLVARIAELEIALGELKKNLPKPAPEKPAVKEEKKVETPAAQQKAEKEPEKTAAAADEPRFRVKDVYMEAYQAFKEGSMPEAREKFSAVIDNFSENEYSDNARFWIGETYYKEENYEDAILAYEELFKINPESDKVPGAMLKQGLAFYALMDKKTGKLILEKLIEKYPDSDQAKLAKKKLKITVQPKKK